MSIMAKRFDFKMQGQTGAGVALGTVNVEFHDDGRIRFIAPGGDVRWINPTANTNALLVQLFTGTNGFPAGTKLFGNG